MKPLMDTGESTGVRTRTDNANITELEAGSSASHSNRDNRRSWVKPVIRFIEVVLCVLFLGGLIASFIRSKNHEIWGLELWKWCVLGLVIVGGRCIMKLTMDYFVVCVIKKIFFLLECKVRYSYYIYSLMKYVRVFLWFGLVLLTCYLLFKSSKVKRSKLDSNVQKYIMKSLATCVIGGFLWVLKNLLVNILTPPFQAKRLFDRFRESLIDQYILEVFPSNGSSAELGLFHRFRECLMVFASNGSSAELRRVVNINWMKQNFPTNVGIKAKSETVINWLKKMEPDEEISAWAMKDLMNLIRSTPMSSITEGLETLAKKEKDITNIFENIFPKTDEVATQIVKRDKGKDDKLLELQSLFNKEASDVAQHITGVEAEASEEGIMVEKQRLRKWLANAIIERRSLAQSLEDTKRLRKKLNKIVSGTVLILVFIIWLILLKILTTGALVVFITQFAALAFIFGDTLKSVFQGIIFVSVMHPFDIGDSCLINREEMVVERINLLSTVFRKNVKDKIAYPNSVLTTLHVKILDKGNRHVIEDSFEITINSSTPQDRITDLKNEIKGFLEDEKQKEKWSFEEHEFFNLKEIKNQKLKIVLSVFYLKTDDQSDWKMVNSRRNILVGELKKILEDENKINGQKNEEEKGTKKDDGQEKEEKGKNKVDDGQTKEEKDKNEDDGRKAGKKKIKYYNILPKVADAN